MLRGPLPAQIPDEDAGLVRTSSRLGDHPGRCPSCGDSLDLHQPDPAQVDRLLGICLDCGDWFAVGGDGHLLGRLAVTPLND